MMEIQMRFFRSAAMLCVVFVSLVPSSSIFAAADCKDQCLNCTKHWSGRYIPATISALSSASDAVVSTIALMNWDREDYKDHRDKLLLASSAFSGFTFVARNFLLYSYVGKYYEKLSLDDSNRLIKKMLFGLPGVSLINGLAFADVLVSMIGCGTSFEQGAEIASTVLTYIVFVGTCFSLLDLCGCFNKSRGSDYSGLRV